MDLSNLLPLLLSLGDSNMGNLLKGFFPQAGANGPPQSTAAGGNFDPSANRPGGVSLQNGNPLSPEALLNLLGPLMNRSAPAETPSVSAESKPKSRSSRFFGLTPLSRIADPTVVWCLNAYFGARS